MEVTTQVKVVRSCHKNPVATDKIVLLLASRQLSDGYVQADEVRYVNYN